MHTLSQLLPLYTPYLIQWTLQDDNGSKGYDIVVLKHADISNSIMLLITEEIKKKYVWDEKSYWNYLWDN